VSTPEILVPVSDDEKFKADGALHRRGEFPDGKRNDLDGLRVDFPEGWGLLRASNTGRPSRRASKADDEAELTRIMDQFREQLAAESRRT
jgi:phosphomannomutase/phosphoglucomutase